MFLINNVYIEENINKTIKILHLYKYIYLLQIIT